jgi:hypothetical protein
MRLGKILLNVAILAALTILPYYGFRLFWQYAGPDIVYRTGYLLWMASSLDETNNRMRVTNIQQVATFATPILLAITGFGWGVLRFFKVKK